MKDRIGFLKQLLTVFLACNTLSCSSVDPDTISEYEARKIVSAEIKRESPNMIEVVDFKKTDGVKQEMFGQKGYLMKYHIKIKFLQNAHQHFTVHQSIIFHTGQFL